jgi:hypothetical protein
VTFGFTNAAFVPATTRASQYRNAEEDGHVLVTC